MSRRRGMGRRRTTARAELSRTVAAKKPKELSASGRLSDLVAFASSREMRRWLLAGSILVLLVSPAAAQTPADKVIRGFAGMTTAFLEIPGNMVRESDARGPAVGIPLGFAKGCGMIVPRVLVGVWEFLTAPFALPDYQPILEPEYPWSYFEGKGSPRR